MLSGGSLKKVDYEEDRWILCDNKCEPELGNQELLLIPVKEVTQNKFKALFFRSRVIWARRIFVTVQPNPNSQDCHKSG